MRSKHETSILENSFVTDLRNMRVNREACDDLCNSIKGLEAEWWSKALVDKAVASTLLSLGVVAVNTIAAMEQYQDDRVNELREMAHYLEGLILCCLSD